MKILFEDFFDALDDKSFNSEEISIQNDYSNNVTPVDKLPHILLNDKSK